MAGFEVIIEDQTRRRFGSIAKTNAKGTGKYLGAT
jgi:hypothetical protein